MGVRSGYGKRGRGGRLRALTMVAAVVAVVASPFLSIDAARSQVSGVALFAGPGWPTTVTVGDTGLPANLVIINNSQGADAVGNLVLDQITLTPSCSNFAPNCAGGTADPGAFLLSATRVGEAMTNCAGRVFTITVIDPLTGEVSFTPAAAMPVLLGPPTLANDLDTCAIDYTFNVLKVPNHDSFPGGQVQTNHIGFAVAHHETRGTVGTGTGSSVTTVLQVAPSSFTTSATPSATLGGPISDTASVTGPAGSPAPTGTVTFTVFGPNNATCTGTPVFTSAAQPLAGGPPTATATSGPFTPPSAGTYRWIAAYSGDANYAAVSTTCNDANESSVVNPAMPAIATSATPSAPLGQPITPNATPTAAGGQPPP